MEAKEDQILLCSFDVTQQRLKLNQGGSFTTVLNEFLLRGKELLAVEEKVLHRGVGSV